MERRTGSKPSDEAFWNFKFTEIIRIGVLHLVYPFKPLLQFQAQHLFPLPISNDRARIARPCVPLVRTVEFDALTVDFDLFHHSILLILRQDFLRRIVRVATGVPNKSRTSALLFFNCFTTHFVNFFPRFLCNRLIVATIPLNFVSLGLIIVSLWVLVSEPGELTTAQAAC